MAATAAKLVVTLEREAEKKHSWRYKEDSIDPVLGTAYVQKAALAKLDAHGVPGNVSKLRVTIEAIA